MPSEQPINRVPESVRISLATIINVLLRRKWLILMFSLASLAAAVAIYLQTPRTYVSEAKLLVRYVLERMAVDPVSAGEQVRWPDASGYSSINAEVEILTSQDIARRVAEMVGPEKILPEGFENPSPHAAAVMIARNLLVTSQRSNSVIQIAFEHTDREIAREVVRQLVQIYLAKHIEIHGGGLVSDFLQKQVDKYRYDLTKTEDELRTLMQETGMVSVEEMRSALLGEISRLRQELLSFEAELVERQTLLKSLHADAVSLPATNEVAVKQQEVPAEKMEEYRGVVLQLDAFRKRERDLLTQFIEENFMVKKTRQLVVETEQAKIKLEKEFPALKQVNVETASTRPDKSVDLTTEAARIPALQAKVEVRRRHLAVAQTNLVNVELMEPRIKRLQAQRDQAATNLRSVQAILDRSTGDTTVGASGISNIAVVQEATPSVPASSKLMKTIGMVLAGGIGGGIALALLMGICSWARRAAPCAEKSDVPQVNHCDSK